MLDLLYANALKNKDALKDKIVEVKHSLVDVSPYWHDYKIRENQSKAVFGAGDGSINNIKFQPFIFYAIGVVGLIQQDGEGVLRVKDSEIGISHYYKHVDDYLRNHMGLMEIQNTIKILKNHNLDFFLFDGSLLGNIIRPFPKMKKSLSQSTMYLEYLENLSSISELMEFKDKIVAISKTSTSTEYFSQKIPDMALFDMHGVKQGYSTPRYMSLADVKRDFPVENDFLRELDFTVFYARLDDFKNLLKFELPYRATEDDIKSLLSSVQVISAGGYPLLLKMAHNEVVIKKGHMEELVRIVDVTEKKGREML